MLDIMFWLFLNIPKNIWSGEMKRKHYVTTFLKTKQSKQINKTNNNNQKRQTAKPKPLKTQTEKHLLKIFYNIPAIFSLITILSSSYSSIRTMRGCSTHEFYKILCQYILHLCQSFWGTFPVELLVITSTKIF